MEKNKSNKIKQNPGKNSSKKEEVEKIEEKLDESLEKHKKQIEIMKNTAENMFSAQNKTKKTKTDQKERKNEDGKISKAEKLVKESFLKEIECYQAELKNKDLLMKKMEKKNEDLGILISAMRKNFGENVDKFEGRLNLLRFEKKELEMTAEREKSVCIELEKKVEALEERKNDLEGNQKVVEKLFEEKNVIIEKLKLVLEEKMKESEETKVALKDFEKVLESEVNSKNEFQMKLDDLKKEMENFKASKNGEIDQLKESFSKQLDDTNVKFSNIENILLEQKLIFEKEKREKDVCIECEKKEKEELRKEKDEFKNKLHDAMKKIQDNQHLTDETFKKMAQLQSLLKKQNDETDIRTLEDDFLSKGLKRELEDKEKLVEKMVASFEARSVAFDEMKAKLEEQLKSKECIIDELLKKNENLNEGINLKSIEISKLKIKSAQSAEELIKCARLLKEERENNAKMKKDFQKKSEMNIQNGNRGEEISNLSEIIREEELKNKELSTFLLTINKTTNRIDK